MKSKSLLQYLSVIGISTASFSALAPAAELKHFWDFEGDEWWLDKAGLAHGQEPGENSTIEIEAGAGDVGKSIKTQTNVGGGDDHLVVTSSQLYAPGAEAFSFSYWIRMPDDGTSDARGIFDFSGNGQDGVQSLYIGATGELAFRIDFPGAGNALAKVPINLEDGEWHSVAATYDPAVGLELHLDGFGVEASVGPVVGPVSMASDCYLGSFNFNGQERPNGLGGNLDDLAVYSGVLSEEEITQLSIRVKPEVRIDSVSYEDGMLAITWPAPDGEQFSVWWSTALEDWAELSDEVFAGPEGGFYEVDLTGTLPERYFLEVRRPE